MTFVTYFLFVCLFLLYKAAKTKEPKTKESKAKEPKCSDVHVPGYNRSPEGDIPKSSYVTYSCTQSGSENDYYCDNNGKFEDSKYTEIQNLPPCTTGKFFHICFPIVSLN